MLISQGKISQLHARLKLTQLVSLGKTTKLVVSSMLVGDFWILRYNFWEDLGLWFDSETWND